MKNTAKRKILLILLSALTVIQSAGCGRPSPETGVIPSPAGGSFTDVNGDFEKAEKWIAENIDLRDAPPVSFTADGRKSADMVWEKKSGETQTVTDYGESGTPVCRILRQIEYVCSDENLAVLLTLTVYPGYPVVEYDSYLVNLSDSVTGVIDGLSCLDTLIPAANAEWTLHYGRGSLGYDPADYEPFDEKLGNGTKRIYCTDGMPTSEYLPYFNAESSGGGGVIVAVNWQGSWSARFRGTDEGLALSAGQYGLSSVMLSNERFKLPGAVLVFYKSDDWQTGQNIWRRWITEHNLMRYTGRRDFTQNVYVCSGLTGAETDISEINGFVSTGLNERFNCVFELDAGWFNGSETSPAAWVNAVGDWEPSPEYSGGGIRQISNMCHENGMKFAMWAEPERLNKKSPSAEALGDAVIYLDSNGRYVPYPGSGSTETGLINYGSEKAQDFVVDLVSRFVREYGIDVFRQDFNTKNAEFWSAYDQYESELVAAKRAGATANHACEGYINTWKRISEANPGLIFDVCAGGGRRYDLESMRFGFMHTKSDYVSDVNSAQCQNLGVYSWNIFTGTGLISPSDIYDVRSRLTLSIGIGASGAQSAAAALDEWASMQKYMYGDYYRLSEYSLDEDAAIAMQFCDAERGEGMIFVYLRAGGFYDVRARALETDALYVIRDKDDPEMSAVTVTGREMTETGFRVGSPDGAPAAVILLYEKAKAE